jgi:hypothetical protein
MFKFFKSIFDDETMGEQIIKTNEKTYALAKKQIPDGNELDWLIATYLGRMQAKGTLRENSQFDAEYICSKFINIPDPLNARALGLAMLLQERSDIVQKYPKFSSEFESIIAKYNPTFYSEFEKQK